MKNPGQFFIIAFIAFSLNIIHAQQYFCIADSVKNILGNKLTGTLVDNILQKDDVLYFMDWKKGKITLENDIIVEDVLIRLRMTDDELIWLRTNDYQPALINNKIVKSFAYISGDGENMLFIKLDNEKTFGIHNPIYARVLHQGSISLFKWHNRTIIQSTGQLRGKDKYIIKKNDEYYVTKLGRRKILRIFDARKKEIKKIARENRFRLRKEKDITNLIELLN